MSEIRVSERVPGRFWYVIAAVLFFGSFIAPAPIILWNVFGRTDDAPRLVAPETKVLHLSRGNYTVFSDGRAVIDGEIVISQGSLSGLRLVVRGADNRNIPVEAVTVGSRYNIGGQTGFAILQFSIPESGNYTVSAEYRDKSLNNRALLSIRKDFLGGFIGSILLAVFLSLAGTFLGIAIFLRTLWKRRRLLAEGIRINVRAMGENMRQAAQNTDRDRPGPRSPASKSPVEHQYDRE